MPFTFVASDAVDEDAAGCSFGAIAVGCFDGSPDIVMSIVKCHRQVVAWLGCEMVCDRGKVNVTEPKCNYVRYPV